MKKREIDKLKKAYETGYKDAVEIFSKFGWYKECKFEMEDAWEKYLNEMKEDKK